MIGNARKMRLGMPLLAVAAIAGALSFIGAGAASADPNPDGTYNSQDECQNVANQYGNGVTCSAWQEPSNDPSGYTIVWGLDFPVHPAG